MTSRPPKRPTQRPALQRPTMLGSASSASAHPPAKAPPNGASGMDELMQQFDAALQDLQDDPSLDSDTRERLRQQFAQAVNDIGTTEGAVAGIPDRAVWMDAVQALRASGEVSENEVNDLIRQINQALQPLQRRESQLAIEFSRRIQTEGQEKALAWFRDETNKASAQPTMGALASSRPGDVPPLLRSEVVNSRSHRLRGPPRQK